MENKNDYLSAEVMKVVEAIRTELAYRAKQYDNSGDFKFEVYKAEYNIIIDILVRKSIHLSLVIPMPFMEDGCLYIGDIIRRCPGSFVYNTKLFSYVDFIHKVMVDNCNQAFGLSILSTPIARLAQLHTVANPALVVRNIQKMINQVVTSLPLSEGPLKDFIMNKRVTFLDPNFSALPPNEKLEYQVAKELHCFPFTGLGLSDSVMSEGNCMLTYDIRNLTPFSAHHHPKRNLFSTAGMSGEEEAIIQTKDEASFPAKRTGYNWVTAFLDLPGNFEDAIIINRKHLGKTVKEERKYKTFGIPCVSEGDRITSGKTLSIERDSSVVIFDELCTYGDVVKVYDDTINFDGKNIRCTTIVISLLREFTDGYKFTNRHGNKGVAVFGDTGVAVNPTTGERVDIDVIVSAKSVMKRKNFGQLFEALVNNVNNNTPIIIDNRLEVNIETLRTALMIKGYKRDLTSTILLSEGRYKGIVGNVFWGFIKTTEDQIWSQNDLEEKRQNGMSKAGVKINPVELRALATVFGSDVLPIYNEILGHAAGTKQVIEQIRVLKSSIGDYEQGLTTIALDKIKPVTQAHGAFKETESEFAGTLADPLSFPKSFLLELPFTYYTKVLKNGTTESSCFEPVNTSDTVEIFKTNKVYVPGHDERTPWKHPSGYLGLNELTVKLNNIVDFYHRERENTAWLGNVYGAVDALFKGIAQQISTKKGSLSQNLTAIRYKNSAKGVAVQNPRLARDTVEIHEDMAKQLGVDNGEVVIVERYPCLGFPSMRLQKIKITRVPKKKYVIGVSGNSLVSQGLDFDGDVIYLLAFKSEKAKEVLAKHFENPRKELKEALDALNSKVVPITKEMEFDHYGVCSFPPPTAQDNADCVRKLAGVKLGTGPIIALCYDVMRIIESTVDIDNKLNVTIELLLDRVANTVFGQKHGMKSLQDDAIKALCLADTDALMGLFEGSLLKIEYEDMVEICNIIRNEARSLGVTDLVGHYDRHINENRSNIIKEIIRKKHPVYFASRAALPPYYFLKYLFDTTGSDDLVSSLVKTRFQKFERGLSD